MKKCFVVVQKIGWPKRINLPECVYRDGGLAEEAAALLVAEGRKAWVKEVPFDEDYIVKGTETGRWKG